MPYPDRPRTVAHAEVDRFRLLVVRSRSTSPVRQPTMLVRATPTTGRAPGGYVPNRALLCAPETSVARVVCRGADAQILGGRSLSVPDIVCLSLNLVYSPQR
jgi:hypothetical protein